MNQGAIDADVPGIFEAVTDDVARIPLPLPMADLKVVNAYAIRGDDGVTLVDPGWANAESESLLVAALARLGYQPGDVRRILVTHAHWDHYTQALKWQREYGATVFLGREERHTIEAFDSMQGVYPNQVLMLRRAGATALADELERLELEPHERDMPVGKPDVWLRGDEEIDCGGRAIVAHATPGHTRGHMVFEDPVDGLLFTGDHVLPRITPSIGFEWAPHRLPLRSYLDSLRFCRTRSEARMLPAHGAVTDEVGSRAEELLVHHEQRLKEVLGLVAAGAETAYDVARQMRWTRRERTLDSLGTVHGMTAVLEVVAHLELLVTQELILAEDIDCLPKTKNRKYSIGQRHRGTAPVPIRS
jgi:glyoxylase-like metal-dependent hydrolase (beta-lactamase superfamily II)